MATKKKLLQAAAGGGSQPGLNVEEVYANQLFIGNSSTQVLTNDIDISNEGGLVWIKGVDQARENMLFDTERGATKYLRSNASNGESTISTSLTQFNSTGFTLGSDSDVNFSGERYASWTFRKARGFFDIITWTGDGSGDRTLSHSLGTTIGAAFVKSRTAGAQYGGNWQVFHRSMGTNQTNYMNLNSNANEGSGSGICPVRNPTSTNFLLRGGGSGEMNVSGVDYVAYLFAHNDGDGTFGETGDQDIIKCGSYTGTGASKHFVDVGFEPQWLLIKPTNSSSNESWIIQDMSRSLSHTYYDWLYANQNNNSANGVLSGGGAAAKATGFELTLTGQNINASGVEYIYIAVRRGPMATLDSSSREKLFKPKFGVVGNGYSGSPELQQLSLGFRPDMTWGKRASSSGSVIAGNVFFTTRLNDRTFMQIGATNAESTSFSGFASFHMDHDDIGVGDIGGFNDSNFRGIYHNWRRAPGFFDIVMYRGNGGSSQAIKHSLGVVPEWIIMKNRDSSNNWAASLLPNASGAYTQELNNNFNSPSRSAYGSGWLYAQPTETQFYVGNQQAVNGSTSNNYIAMLFASLDGVSKCGQYTGTGGSQNIDCGFSNSARFVLIKRLSSGSQWWAFDTERGINAGNDPSMEVSSGAADEQNYDHIDSYSSGFAVNANGYDFNSSGETYFFYAVA